jgi:predicted metal-binding membrane protein
MQSAELAPEPISALPVRERFAILAELGILTALSWIYLVRMPMSASDFGPAIARLAAPLRTDVIDVSLTFMMWAVMMIAMMLPSASPVILMYQRIARSRPSTSKIGSLSFAAGYLGVWTVFSIGATAGQIGLQHASMISGALTLKPWAAAAVLIAGGVYQLSALKQSCLRQCQSPMGFFMTHWRDGAAGAFRMGVEHGAFCLGCCWMLMMLLFVAGVMNLAWIAAISGFVILEKVVPYPRAIANSTGAVLVASGIVLLVLRV